MTITIDRLPGQEADLSILADLIHESIHCLAAGAYTPRQINAWSPRPMSAAELRKHLNGQIVWMASDDEGPTAFMSMSAQGYIGLAFAHPRAAGTGPAKKVYDHMEADAREAGLAMLYGDISVAARDFFEKRGFVVVAEQEPVRNGVAVPNFRMEKMLKP